MKILNSKYWISVMVAGLMNLPMPSYGWGDVLVDNINSYYDYGTNFIDLSMVNSQYILKNISGKNGNSTRTSNGNATSTNSPANVTPTANSANVAALGCSRNPAITTQINTSLANGLSQATGVDRDRLLGELNSGEIQSEHARLLRQFGMNPDNLGDVMAAYWIGMWEIVNGREPNGREVSAAYRQLQAIFVSNPQLASLSDADKQRTAETLGNMMMFGYIAYIQLKNSGDSAGLQQLQQDVYGFTKQQGLDLRALNLTDRGFVTR